VVVRKKEKKKKVKELNNTEGSSNKAIELSSGSIILEKDPFYIYIPAVMAVVIGLLFILVPGTSGGFTNPKTLLPQAVMCLLGTCAVTMGIALLRIGLAEILLDRSSSRIVIRKRLSKAVIRTIDMASIQELTIDSHKDSDGDTTYRLAFKLISGELVPLTKSSGYSKENVETAKRRIQLQLNGYGGLNSSSSLVLPESPFQNREISEEFNKQPNFYEPESKRQWRKLFISAAITVLLVTVAPFASLWFASQEQPSTSLEITAGKPNAATIAKIQTNKKLLLAPEEEILWVGTPEPGREGTAKIWFLPFAIIWTLFSLLWTSIALGTAITQKSFATGFMVVFGLPFVGIGLTMLSIPYVSYKRELHTIYVITEERALSLSNDDVNIVAKFDNKHFGPIKANTYNDKRMDLLFWSSLDPESSSGDPCRGFWGIEEGEGAKAILEARLAKRNSLF
jgi:hypothetical protein